MNAQKSPQEALESILSHKIKLIGVYSSGAAIASGEDFQAAFTHDIETIKNLQDGLGDSAGRAKGTKIDRFRFEAGSGGFICLDLDRGHGSGGDGVKELLDLLEQAAFVIPDNLKDLDGGSFPCYVKTPSGGIHLYYKAPPLTNYRHTNLSKCVELFQFGNLITAPGSFKNGTPYTLHGSLESAPLFPGIIAKLIQKPETPAPLKARFSYEKPEGYKAPPSLELIAQWAERDGKANGKNRLCYEIALRAARPDYGYDSSQVEDFLRNYPGTAGHDQIRDAVKSAYKGR